MSRGPSIEQPDGTDWSLFIERAEPCEFCGTRGELIDTEGGSRWARATLQCKNAGCPAYDADEGAAVWYHEEED